MAGFSWLNALAGGAQGASRGLGGVIDILEKANDDKRSDARYNEGLSYRNQHDAMEMLQSGRFRLKKILDDAAGPLATDPNAPELYGRDSDPNAPTQAAPPASATPVTRALSLADLEAIPQDELDARGLKTLDAQQSVLDKHQPYEPRTKQDYMDVHTRLNRSGDAVQDESRAALKDQRIANLRAAHVSRAVAGAIGRLDSQGVKNPTTQQIHAAAVNELLANPEARKLFLTSGRASDYDQLRDEVWSGIQGRSDKLTHGKKPIEWAPDDSTDTEGAAPPATSGNIDLTKQTARKTVPDQGAYDQLRQGGMSATAIRTRYNLSSSIKRIW
jgi:hypothetical protein